MNIDDILSEKAPKLDAFLTGEMVRLLGEKKVSELSEEWGGSRTVRDWFFSYTYKITSSGAVRPYDLYLAGEGQKVEARLEYSKADVID